MVSFDSSTFASTDPDVEDSSSFCSVFSSSPSDCDSLAFESSFESTESDCDSVSFGFTSAELASVDSAIVSFDSSTFDSTDPDVEDSSSFCSVSSSSHSG